VSGLGGAIDVSAGPGMSSGGAIGFHGGFGTSGPGGTITFTAGAAVSVAGQIVMLGGDSNSAQGGNVTIGSGTGLTDGNIVLVNLPTADPAVKGAIFATPGGAITMSSAS